jgi:WD40 repeat protein
MFIAKPNYAVATTMIAGLLLLSTAAFTRQAAQARQAADALPDGAIARVGEPRPAHASMVYSVTFAPNGKTLAVGAAHATIRLLEPDSGKVVRELPVEGYPVVYGLAFSPDGSKLATAGFGGPAPYDPQGFDLWELATGKPTRQAPADRGFVNRVAFLPDGKRLVTGHAPLPDAPNVLLWDLGSGKKLREFPGLKGNIEGLSLSADGKVLAAASKDVVCVWEVASGKQLARFAGAAERVAVALSPDGRTLAAAVPNEGVGAGVVRLWTVATGKDCGQFQVRDQTPTALAFSPDGGTLAASYGSLHRIVIDRKIQPQEQTIQLWDVTGQKVRRQLRGHQDEIRSLAFSRDGHRLASGSEDGTVMIWDSADQFDIRAEDGTILIAVDQILAYEWATHTLTLKPGVRKNLFMKFKGSLANGHTFGVAVGGKTIYHGVFKSIISSSSSSSPVILLDEAVYEPKLLKESQVRIGLGYPGKEHFKGEDPRGDPRVERALKASGKLTKAKAPETDKNGKPDSGAHAEKSVPEGLPPLDYLAHLTKVFKTRKLLYCPPLDGPLVAKVQNTDLPNLVELLWSKDPCAATLKVGARAAQDGSSTVGHEAAVLIDSLRLGKPYPIANSSREHPVDRDTLLRWWKERKGQETDDAFLVAIRRHGAFEKPFCFESSFYLFTVAEDGTWEFMPSRGEAKKGKLSAAGLKKWIKDLDNEGFYQLEMQVGEADSPYLVVTVKAAGKKTAKTLLPNDRFSRAVEKQILDLIWAGARDKERTRKEGRQARDNNDKPDSDDANAQIAVVDLHGYWESVEVTLVGGASKLELRPDGKFLYEHRDVAVGWTTIVGGTWELNNRVVVLNAQRRLHDGKEVEVGEKKRETLTATRRGGEWRLGERWCPELKKVEMAVELTVIEVGRVRTGRSTRADESEPLTLVVKAPGEDGGLIHLDVSGEVATRLKRLGVEDPAEHFRGKVVRVRGTLERLTRRPGPASRIEIKDLDQFEIIRKP